MHYLLNRTYLVGLIVALVLALPPLRYLFESTMTAQMLMQMPLLVFAGWWAAQDTPGWLKQNFAAWDFNGINGLLLASLTSIIWMLPIALDAALENTTVTVAKFLSLPLLIGAPIAISWPRAGFVVRGIFLAELIATILRVGWLYLISPVRLCSNYLLDDQERLGKYLVVVGFAIMFMLVWKLVWGKNNSANIEAEP